MNKPKGITFYEHLKFIVKGTTPLERFRWLEDAWNFWHKLNYQKAIRNKKQRKS